MSDVQSEIERMKVWENWNVLSKTDRVKYPCLSYETIGGVLYVIGLPSHTNEPFLRLYCASSPRKKECFHDLSKAVQWCIDQYKADQPKPAAPKADAVEWRYLMLAGGMAAFMPDGYTLEIRCGMSLLNNTAIVHHTNGKHLVYNHETLEEAQQWCVDTYREMVAKQGKEDGR